MCYTGAVLVPCGFLLPFDVLWGTLVRFHLVLCVSHFGVVVLVRVLVGMLFPHVGPPLEVPQGLSLALSIGYAPLEVVSLLGGAALVNISEIFLGTSVCLSPNVVSGLVGVELRRAWVRSVAAYVAASCEGSIGKVNVSGKNSFLSWSSYA